MPDQGTDSCRAHQGHMQIDRTNTERVPVEDAKEL